MANEIANQALINHRLSASTNIGSDELCPTKATILANWDKSQVLNSVYEYTDDCVCRIEDIIKGKDAEVIKDFDCIVVKFNWYDGGGQDLDTSTMILNGDFAGSAVGCGQHPGVLLTTIVSGETFTCLNWGGDDTSGTGGTESVLIYFSNIVNSENYSTQPDILDVGLYGGWHRGHSGETGDIEVEISAYKGGTMVLDNKVFNNEGGELKFHANKVINCQNDAQCVTAPSAKQYLATISYYKDNKNGVFVSFS